MKYRISAWAITAVIFGLLMAGGMHLAHAHRLQLGRDAFMAKQADRYDRIFSKPDHIVPQVVFCVFMSGAFLGIYELVTFGITSTLKRFDGEGNG